MKLSVLAADITSTQCWRGRCCPALLHCGKPGLPVTSNLLDDTPNKWHGHTLPRPPTCPVNPGSLTAPQWGGIWKGLGETWLG
jgi:hypothetical protein